MHGDQVVELSVLLEVHEKGEVEEDGEGQIEVEGEDELKEKRSCMCVGCDIVQADHAPEAGVAQEIFHGILVRHHGRNQEEVEEGLEKEVERQGRREHSNNHVHMHGWDEVK